jgi:putative restriction endonuclease
VALRLAMQKQVPLLYVHGVVKGQCLAVWQMFVIRDSPEALAFTVNVDDRRLALDGPPDSDAAEVEGRRRYVTRTVQARLHQELFRQRVIAAYQTHCAICRLRHQELLEAADILPDGHPRGLPVVPNGLALCRLHHAAFDSNIIAIRPDYRIELRQDVLNEVDGPMLKHGLQGFHNLTIHVPRRESQRPDREFLEERYAHFRRAG